jgi:hypothetical protein
MVLMYRIIGADGKEYGPVPIDVVRQWLAEGRANAQTRVLPDGATEWKALGELPEFQTDISSATTTPSGTVPQPIRPLAYPPTSRTNTLAIFGLILGVLSVTLSFCCFGLPFNLAGIVISTIALVQIKEQKQEGRGLAIAGLALSIISIILRLLLLIFVAASGGAGRLHHLYHL